MLMTSPDDELRALELEHANCFARVTSLEELGAHWLLLKYPTRAVKLVVGRSPRQPCVNVRQTSAGLKLQTLHTGFVVP